MMVVVKTPTPASVRERTDDRERRNGHNHPAVKNGHFAGANGTLVHLAKRVFGFVLLLLTVHSGFP